MIKELLRQQRKESALRQEQEKFLKKTNNQQCLQFSVLMDQPELSLGLSRHVVVGENTTATATTTTTNSSSSESDQNNMSRKRKYSNNWDRHDHLDEFMKVDQTSVELQVKDPLPLDWEQCLDLESGRMYYLNRNTLKRSWNWPKETTQKLDLELNISPFSPSSSSTNCDEIYTNVNSSKKQNSSPSNSMVAVACVKCHLLVMLCKSSPTCPNCKYMHSLPSQQSPPRKTLKSFDTLSLLN